MSIFTSIFGNKKKVKDNSNDDSWGKEGALKSKLKTKSKSKPESKSKLTSKTSIGKTKKPEKTKKKNEIDRKAMIKKLKKEKLEKLKQEKAEKLMKIKEEKLIKERKKKEKLGKLKAEKEEKKKVIIEKKNEEKASSEASASKGQGKNKDASKPGEGLDKYFKTYVPGFDELLDPGVPRGSAILVEGGPGSGKTLFCLTALVELCKRGKKILYMSFEEPEERLREHIRNFGSDPNELEKKGLLYIKRFNALDIARSVEALLSEAKKELLIEVQPVLIPSDFKADIVLVDSLTSISSAFSGESSRFRVYMEQLFRYLESHNITSFLVREVASPTHIGGNSSREQEEAVSFLSDGIIAIYNVIYQNGERKRAMEILKMRGVNVQRKIVEYEVTKKGVIIHGDKLITGNYKLT